WLGGNAQSGFKRLSRKWQANKRLAVRRWRHWQTRYLLKNDWRSRVEAVFSDLQIIVGSFMLLVILIGLSLFG
ncbi:MAG: hypothetical protein GW843_09670, partial [Thiomicrospira sp.]